MNQYVIHARNGEVYLVLADTASEAWHVAEASGYRVERVRLVREDVEPSVPMSVSAD